MPAIAPGSKVLVTGANGFVGSWVVKSLLEKGYSVRGTVRSENKGANLRELFASFGDQFEIAVVEDISKDSAFDDAVVGVAGIAHVASPCWWDADDPQELIAPAVNGTIGILSSALKANRTVKRIVITSSVAAVVQYLPHPKIFSEKDWDDQAVRQVGEHGRAASGVAKYRASKTLAEKAAWEFTAKHQDEIDFDLVVLNPSYAFGPVIHEAPSLSALNSSSADLLQVLLTPSNSPSATNAHAQSDALTTSGSTWVDVRDVAEAHLRALEVPEAGDERIILDAGPFVWQEWIDAAHALTPQLILPSGMALAASAPWDRSSVVHQIRYDTSKAARILGVEKYRSMEETVRAVLEDVGKRDWYP